MERLRSCHDPETLEAIIAEGLLDEPADWMRQSTELRDRLEVVFEQVNRRRNIETRASVPLRTRWKWLLVAAAIAIATIVIGRFFVPQAMNPGEMDVAPGGHRATLTLSDGRKVDLSEAHEGIVVGDGITYLDGTAITPEDGRDGMRTTDYHVLSTPQGGTYRITLLDGTEVWLNSASTLCYPSRFDGRERVVELNGEAYFKVKSATGGEWPFRAFRVITEGQEIEVLGTSFNVNAYEDESVTVTTLVTGSLKVALSGGPVSGESSVILEPGEEAVRTVGELVKRPGDPSASSAWKDGVFVFNNATLEAIARQIGRWYDIEIECVGLPLQTFSAEIPRNVKLSTIVKVIESISDVRCELKGDADGNNGERRLVIARK